MTVLKLSSDLKTVDFLSENYSLISILFVSLASLFTTWKNQSSDMKWVKKVRQRFTSRRPEVLKKGVLRNLEISQNSLENTCVRVSVLIKLHIWTLQLY